MTFRERRGEDDVHTTVRLANGIPTPPSPFEHTLESKNQSLFKKMFYFYPATGLTTVVMKERLSVSYKESTTI